MTSETLWRVRGRRGGGSGEGAALRDEGGEDSVLCASAACVAPLAELYRALARQPGYKKPALNNDYGRE